MLICFFKNEYFDWKKNLSFSSVKSYFQILPLIKFTNILKMAQFLYGSVILRNINLMLHFVTFSSGVEHSYMANGTFWIFKFFILICFLLFNISVKTKLSCFTFPLGLNSGSIKCCLCVYACVCLYVCVCVYVCVYVCVCMCVCVWMCVFACIYRVATFSMKR